MNKKPTRKEANEKQLLIVDDYLNEFSYKDLKKKYNISAGYIAYIKNKYNLPPRKIKNTNDTFYQKIKKASGCWLWTGAINDKGYGIFGIHGKHIFAHRYSYELHNKEIPLGMVIMHTCDHPLCVNPEHLKIGTQIENIKDCLNKERNARGEKHASARLKETEALEIKFSSERNFLLAIKFDIPQGHVSNIKSGKKWKYLTREMFDEHRNNIATI